MLEVAWIFIECSGTNVKPAILENHPQNFNSNIQNGCLANSNWQRFLLYIYKIVAGVKLATGMAPVARPSLNWLKQCLLVG